MIAVSEPQVWTLIGVFATALLGMLTVVSSLFLRVLRAEIGGLRAEIQGEITGMRGEINARIEGLDRRIDHLDRDVQMLVRHTFPDP